MNELQLQYFEISQIATQPVGVPDPMGIKIEVQKGNYIEIIGYKITAGTFTAGRVVTLKYLDTVSSTFLIESATLTSGLKLVGPAQRVIQNTVTGSTTGDNPGSVGYPLKVLSQHELRLQAAAVTDTKTLTFSLMGLCRVMPTISNIGGGVVLTDTSSKIV